MLKWKYTIKMTNARNKSQWGRHIINIKLVGQGKPHKIPITLLITETTREEGFEGRSKLNVSSPKLFFFFGWNCLSLVLGWREFWGNIKKEGFWGEYQNFYH